MTSRTTRRWVLPKGSIGSGLTAYEAAVVEAYEEAGIGGRIGRTCIGVYGYTKRNEKKQKRCLVKVFPLRVRDDSSGMAGTAAAAPAVGERPDRRRPGSGGGAEEDPVRLRAPATPARPRPPGGGAPGRAMPL